MIYRIGTVKKTVILRHSIFVFLLRVEESGRGVFLAAFFLDGEDEGKGDASAFGFLEREVGLTDFFVDFVLGFLRVIGTELCEDPGDVALGVAPLCEGPNTVSTAASNA